ncbi:MAG: DMT family protein [Bacteroidales bacterium]|nr:DMT family protein [Bacteroidales bacterium]MDY6348872.1 DMT family protein [Bacteroidales bacterium]
MRGVYTIMLLVVSNVFMTFAWYSHLRLQSYSWFSKLSLPLVVLFSWGIALMEYSFMVPANRIGYEGNGGPFNLWQLKVIQEFLSLSIFTLFTLIFFKGETLTWNKVVGFALLVLAVYFIFKK